MTQSNKHKKHRHRGHSHHHHHEISGNNLLYATLLNITITVVEIVGGIMSNSIALLSDALHNLGDGIAVFLAYLANKISKRDANMQHTFGFKRVEIVAAFINGSGMLVICVYLFFQAYQRLQHPQAINGLMMILIATIGLFANLIAVKLLRKDSQKNLNAKAAYIHLLGDTLSSVAVVIGGILIYFFKIYWLDPVLTFLIGLYIMRETWGVIRQAYLILLQATPQGLNLEKVKERIEAISEVANIHHVHVWNLTDKQIHFECHIDLNNDCPISQTEQITTTINKILYAEFQINHTTIQYEYNCCGNKNIISDNA